VRQEEEVSERDWAKDHMATDARLTASTPFLGIRPGCQVNNNLYPANGVLNMPNLTGGCTCNFAPASVACVPAGVVRRGGLE
jgi:hypothetical protein